jgi:hypothetical protein
MRAPNEWQNARLGMRDLRDGVEDVTELYS